MAKYIENTIIFKEDDKIETSLLLYGKLDNFTIGKSKIERYINYYTFLRKNKDYFGNGCKYKNINECVSFILSNHKEQINRGYKPYLIVNGVNVPTYVLVS